MEHDSEVIRLRAHSAIDALEAVLELIPENEAIEAKHVLALIATTNTAVRAALPTSRFIRGMND